MITLRLDSELEKNIKQIAQQMGVSKSAHRSTFRKNYLHQVLNAGFIEMTIPNKTQSSNQKYFLTTKGSKAFKERQ